jgi:hypothetical protein
VALKAPRSQDTEQIKIVKGDNQVRDVA